jgi:tRNA wybutosine-synthesizing protein 1
MTIKQQAQTSEQEKENLSKAQYRFVGNHSAVKTCGWTKNMIRGKGGCYKLKFYGIMSNQCMQMTTSMSCANRCSFCWRGYKAPVSKEWKWAIDDPEMIYDESLKAHHKLLVGFAGSDKSNKKTYEKSKEVKHVALSLTGEPITYPRINELLLKFNQQGVSTFMVTNAQYWEQIRDLNPVTQLYLSIDAPTKELLKKVDLPLFPDFWERMHKSLEELSKKKERTCIRLTIIKGINDFHPEKYAKLINSGRADFIEVKSYMHVGPSQQRLSRENMPLHEEVVTFSKELNKFLQDYEIVSEHIPSRVVMFARKEFMIDNQWHTWINYPKWHELVNSGKEFSKLDYSIKTPQVGLSGKGTIDAMPPHIREKFLKENPVFVDEETEEIEFYENTNVFPKTL